MIGPLIRNLLPPTVAPLRRQPAKQEEEWYILAWFLFFYVGPSLIFAEESILCFWRGVTFSPPRFDSLLRMRDALSLIHKNGVIQFTQKTITTSTRSSRKTLTTNVCVNVCSKLSLHVLHNQINSHHESTTNINLPVVKTKIFNQHQS